MPHNDYYKYNDESDDNTTVIKKFKDFIEQHKCDKTGLTHTTYTGGKYSFVGEAYQEFLERYTNILKLKIKFDLHFIERPNDNGVTFLFIDVDYDHIGEDRLYNKDHIEQIIRVTNDFLKENFIVTDYQLTAFVTEKSEPVNRSGKEDMYKDGFHIYYPYLPMKESYRYFVIDYLISLMIDNKFLDGIEYKNSVEKIFDTSIIKSNGITMIGSRKKEGEPYKLTHIYDTQLNDIGIDCYDDEDLVYVLSNQQYDEDGSVEACESAMADIDRVNGQYNGGNKKKIIDVKKKGNMMRGESDGSQRNNGKFDKISGVVVNEQIVRKKTVENQRDIELASALCKILSKKRAGDYNSWIRVAFALRAVDESLFDAFDEFSKKDMSKYGGKVSCADIWKEAKKFEQFYTIGSLRHWARIDNSKEFYTIIRKLNDAIFGRAESGKHVDIAQVVYELYKDRFVCIDITKKKWYEFQDHRWVIVQSAYTLEELISDEVRRMMATYCSEKLRESANNADGFEQDNRKFQKMMKMVDNLADVKFRENVVKACANKFYDSKFQLKLDSNNYLVGFTNGVYDLKEFAFRDGLPSDYISKTVGYDWLEYTGDEPVFTKINNFFSQVHVDQDMREYVLTFIASILRGGSDQKVHIWTGGGGNGKSATIDLVKSMMGDYFGSLPITVLTRKRGSSSSATPEFADKYGKRFLVLNESEHNDVIYVGQMKEYSGGDTIMARPLYGDPFEYKPQFKMALTCNNLPNIPSTDDGTWRRLRVTPYESKFVDRKPNGPREFLKDEELQEEFPLWKQPFMWLIITKYYPIYEAGIKQNDLEEDEDNKIVKNDKLTEEDATRINRVLKFKIREPAKVKMYTKNYKKDSDVYMEFLEENFIKTNDPVDKENIMFMFETFRQWYTASYTEKPPAKKVFISYLKKAKYDIDKQNVVGVKYALGLD
jgi:P4 family phage/plasmid primase-like protien